MKPGIFFVGSQSVSDFRMTLAARELAKLGYRTHVEIYEVPYFQIQLYDSFVISRPNRNLCDFAKVAMEAGKVVVVDMDDDFHKIPKSHPGYNILGPGAIGHPGGAPGDYLRELEKTVRFVTGFTTPTAVVGERWGRLDYKLIPNCFDETNPHWTAPRLADPVKFSIGWAGSATHLEDVKPIVPALRRFLLERDNVQIVIGGDDAVYRLFADLPESKKLFIPGLEYERYPVMYRYWDVSLAPLLDSTFARAKSDIKLVEAGARGIPWIAPALPQYTAWGIGGWFATTVDEWYDYLCYAMDNPDLAEAKGAEGKTKAWDERNSALYGAAWADVLEGWL